MGIENEIKREGKRKIKRGGTENRNEKIREREIYSLRTIK